ncbi:MAG: DUF2029 domain-containing protein [Candidatus Eremiobacteraeota bacterium]|nr:DUF2029 domain-containing protein [Candidatus Eremiobacteraeota bacterium]
MAALALSVLCIVLALTVARPQVTPGPIMRDFESYYAAGRAWTAHDNPYSTELWRHERTIPGVRGDRWEALPFLGFPAFLPLWALLAAAPFNVAAVLWGIVMIVLLLFAVWVMLEQVHGRDVGSFLSVAAMCIAFAPLTSALALGQAALPSWSLIVIATALFVSAPGVAGIATFFAALQPNLAIALLSQIRYRNVLFAIAIAMFALIALALIVVGFHGFASYLGELFAHGAAERHALIQFTPSAIGYGLGLPIVVANGLGVTTGIAAAIIWIAIMLNRRLTRCWRLAITCALLPFAAPFFHEHDFVIELVPMLMCLCIAPRRIWPIAAAATVLVAVDWLGLAQRPNAILQSALLVLALLCAIFALSDQPLRLHRFALLAALLLIPAALLAHRFPAPIWPDALPAHVTWIRATLPDAWHAQLQAAHELSPQPLWAALRLLTLFGSGLLAWCSIATARGAPSTSSG